MKPNNFSQVRGQTVNKVLLALGSAVLVPAIAFGDNEAAAPAELNNVIGLTVGGADVDGDDAAMMRRTRTNGDFYGGIDTFQFSTELNDSTTLTLDGHALYGLEDYEFNLNLEKTGLGFIKAGFKQFRTWYDASPGYLAGANMAASNAAGLFDDERSIDRGEIYFETGLRMEDVPEVTFSYRHLYRNGDKDSTCWGDSLANTSWGGVAGSNPAFKFLPALWDIDETTDIFELDVEYTLGNTDLAIGAVYENYKLNNSRYTPRRGTKPTAPPPTATGALGLNNVTLTERNDADIFAGHFQSITRFSDQAWLTFAAAYSSMDTDIDGGSRALGAYWALPGQIIPGPNGGAAAKRDYAYNQMLGGSNFNQFVTNLNFMWSPVADLTITPSLRYENESIDTISSFQAYNTNQTWQGLQSLGSYTEMDSTTGAIDIRYTGISDLVLYCKGLWGTESEGVARRDLIMPAELLGTDIAIDEQEYVIGANWYAMSNLSFGVQGMLATRDQALDHFAGNQTKANTSALVASADGGANNLRPVMVGHNTDVENAGLRMTWRPLNNLSLVTRYDYRQTEYENQGINWSPATFNLIHAPAGTYLTLIDSGEVESHIISQSVTWNATSRLYLQGSASYVSAETNTPERYTGSSNADYFTGSLSAGYVIDDRTELTASYYYYGASNYANSVNFNGFGTMGYGLNTEDHAITLTLTRVLAENLIWNLRYGYMTSNTDPAPDQSGGLNDFDAHMVSTGLQYRF